MVALDPETGEVQGSFGGYGAEDGSFVYPTGIAYDAERDWFVVADTANDRLQIVRLPDSGGGMLADVRGAVPGSLWLWLLPPLFALLSAGSALMARGGREVTVEYVALDDGGGA